MSTVEKLEVEITKLSTTEVAQLTRWLNEYDAKLWDQQMEQDAKSGRLDHLWKQAEAEIADGQAKPLDELLTNS